MTKFHYVTWTSFGKLSKALAERIRKSGKEFDLVIGIARGGLPASLVIADQLHLKIDFINVKSYTGIYKKSKPVVLSTLTGSIKGKRILLVDDLVDHGGTMIKMVSYLKKKGTAEVTTAVLFVKPWSTFKPDFYLKTTDSWVVFPWNEGETKVLLKE